MKVQRSIFFILLALLSLQGKAQPKWSQVYHDNEDAPKYFFTESYDHGYLLMGRIHWAYPRYNWLVKTDINGSILWEKFLGDGINAIGIYGIESNSENDLYLAGQRGLVGDYADPLIIKLNECGEKEWCKIFPSQGYKDNFRGLCTTSDGGCASIIVGESLNDKDYLVRFSKDGELLWMYYYPPTTGHTDSEYTTNVILTPDQGFLMTGFCYYANPWDTLGYLSPYYIKTDSVGNFKWEVVAGLHPNNIDGDAHTTVIGPNGKYFYSSISHYYRNGIGDAPGLLKMDMNGQIDTVYDLSTPGNYGILFDARFISNSTLAASASWEGTTAPKAVIIDTIGNILHEQDLVDELYMASVRTTFDNKALFYTMEYIEDEEQWDTYLFKLNEQLENDTFYSYPYQYDTLCPYSIPSDTIPIEGCDIIVGIHDYHEPVAEEDLMEVYPNPSAHFVNIRYPISDPSTSSGQVIRFSIQLYDTFGRLMEEIIVPQGQEESRVNLSNYPDGIYIAVLRNDEKVLGRKKFVVAH